MEPQCGAAEDIAACIEEKTYNQSAIIKDIILGFSAQTSMTSQELWSEDFTHTFYGMGHTLNMETKLNPDDETTQLFIIFQDLSNYMVISLNKMHFFIIILCARCIFTTRTISWLTQIHTAYLALIESRICKCKGDKNHNVAHQVVPLEDVKPLLSASSQHPRRTQH